MLPRRQEEEAERLKLLANDALNISVEAYNKAYEAINKQKNIRLVTMNYIHIFV